MHNDGYLEINRGQIEGCWKGGEWWMGGGD